MAKKNTAQPLRAVNDVPEPVDDSLAIALDRAEEDAIARDTCVLLASWTAWHAGADEVTGGPGEADDFMVQRALDVALKARDASKAALAKRKREKRE